MNLFGWQLFIICWFYESHSLYQNWINLKGALKFWMRNSVVFS
jgi:hypothetical protein